MSKSRERTSFGERMLQARERAGFTQMQVRQRLKVSQGTLSELERMAHGTKRLIEFAALYGVDATWLATGKGEMDGATAIRVAEPAGRDYTIDAQARELLADFRDLLPEEQAQWRAKIHDRAQQMRQHAERVVGRTAAKTKKAPPRKKP